MECTYRIHPHPELDDRLCPRDECHSYFPEPLAWLRGEVNPSLEIRPCPGHKKGASTHQRMQKGGGIEASRLGKAKSEQLAARAQTEEGEGEEQEPCPDYHRGLCRAMKRKAPPCKKKHPEDPPPKQIQCNHFKTGPNGKKVCRYGSDCLYATEAEYALLGESHSAGTADALTAAAGAGSSMDQCVQLDTG